jgi:hypothetical protein
VKKETRVYPTEIAGINWVKIKKGDVIPEYKLKEAWALHIGNGKPWTEFSPIKIKEWLEAARNSIDSPLVFKQSGGDMHVLTDAQAIAYLNGQATAGLRKHRSNTRRMFSHIDLEQLGPAERHQLETNQARHALIASAADGARQQTVRLLREGQKLPRMKPPDED